MIKLSKEILQTMKLKLKDSTKKMIKFIKFHNILKMMIFVNKL